MCPHQDVRERTLGVNLAHQRHTVAHVAYREACIVAQHAHVVELVVSQRHLEAVVVAVADECVAIVSQVVVGDVDVARDALTLRICYAESHIRDGETYGEGVAFARSEAAGDAVVAEIVLAQHVAFVRSLSLINLNVAVMPCKVEHNLVLVVAHNLNEAVGRHAQIYCFGRLHLLVVVAEHSHLQTSDSGVVLPFVVGSVVGAEHHEGETVLLACAVGAAEEVACLFRNIYR